MSKGIWKHAKEKRDTSLSTMNTFKYFRHYDVQQNITVSTKPLEGKKYILDTLKKVVWFTKAGSDIRPYVLMFIYWLGK